METTDFSWIDFYQKFATKLLDYQNDREMLVQKINQVYEHTKIKKPNFGNDKDWLTIDPFTIFGLFNKGIRNDNRIKLIQEFNKEFNVGAKIPVDFEGIPVVNNLKANFFWSKDEARNQEIDCLWNLFEKAIIFADKKSNENRARFIKAFDIVREQKGIRWNITMGLFWIRPYSYINLDSRNRWYLTNTKYTSAELVAKLDPMLKELPFAKEYIEINQLFIKLFTENKNGFKSFPELSNNAWQVSEKVNQTKKGNKENTSKAIHIRWFKPILQALKDLGATGTPPEVRKQIIKNEKLTKKFLSETRGKSKVNKFENEVAFARNDLVYGGYIDNSKYGIWSLTEEGFVVDMTDELASNLFTNHTRNIPWTIESGNNALIGKNVKTIHYWVFQPGDITSKWEECYKDGKMLLGWNEIGNIRQYSSKEEIRSELRKNNNDTNSHKNSVNSLWQFAYEMKPGDVVFVINGSSEVVGRGVVTSDYKFDENRMDDYSNFRNVNWKNKGKWMLENESLASKTLTDITVYTDLVKILKSFFDEDDAEDKTTLVIPPYSKEDFLEDVYMNESAYDNLVAILKKKKNIILHGAPGVGKTYASNRLAFSMMGVKDVDRVQMIQFHQSYSYEDFMMGFRPTANGFELQFGSFYTFCKKAEDDSENDYFFVIDEINRGNLSKIFGEIFMLIEQDKRESEIQLLYKDEKFSVPKNIYIIGMMNTADRSLAMLDYALRRRFAFVDMEPGFNTEQFLNYQGNLNNEKFDRLIDVVKNLNEAITKDESLGEGFCIGHSYFCSLTPEKISDNDLTGIVNYELIPLLKEYWFDEAEKIKKWSNKLRSAVK